MVEFIPIFVYLCAWQPLEIELTGMSGKLLEEIRGADQSVELAVRDWPEKPAEGCYPFPRGNVGHLAESEPAAFFEDLSTLQYSHRSGNPVMILATADHNGLPGIDVLEALLYVADPKAMCRQTAIQALQVFGSVGAVLSASVHDLTIRLGLNEQVAYALKAIYAGMRSVLREPIRERIEIGSFSALIDYVGLSLKHEKIEVLRVLYLDRKNRLISDEESGRGTVDHVPLYPREIVRRALELGASAVILIHNHPSGDHTPSAADATVGQNVERALGVMGIALHDSLVLGTNGFSSLRTLGKP
jgi:DNA repair protein RadC